MITKSLSAIVLTLLLGSAQTYATQTVRELFDGLNAGHDYSTIDGLTNQDVTTVGLQGGWEAFPKGYDSTGTNWVSCTNIVYKDTFTVNWPLGDLEYYNGGLILTSGGANGCLNANLGGLNTVTDTNTGSAFGQWTSQAYATHPLGGSAGINFQASGTYYFSVRIVKSYQWAPGDSSAGIGFSSGSGPGDHFVGIGVTRPSCLLDDGTTEIGDTTYISTGTLGQAGISSHPDDTGGPYLPVVYGNVGLWTNQAAGTDQYRTTAFLVGKLTTTPSGASTLSVKTYLPFCPVYTNGVLFDKSTNYDGTPITLEQDINNPAWEATYSFTETSVMTNLLVWMHGSTMEYDAIRVGTTYGDVVGFERIGAPQASPANTVYEGVNVTISQNTGVNSGSIPMSFQWRSNGVDIVDATNATLVLANPTTAATANYSVTVSNFYGGPVTSPETLITINPGIKPVFVSQPQPVALTRYLGAPSASFSVVVDGTPPFTYQWQHAGTNIGSATTTASVTNMLTVGPITLADAGNYTVAVTNAYGSTNSEVTTLTVSAPAARSYAAALLSLPTSPTNLFGYWRMDDNATTNDPTINDYWNGQNGQVNVSDLNIGKVTFGVEGASYLAFPTPHLATQLGSHGELWDKPYRVDLHNLPSAQTNMTFTMWVKGGVRLVARNGYGQAYGLENQGGNALRFYWGAYNSTNGVRTAQWDTGLSAPESEWTFVALVVDGTNATVYVGSKISFTSASTVDIGGIPDPENGGYMTIVNSTTLGESNLRLGVGRNPIPWADDGNGAPWTSTGGTWSDIGVFYQVLTPAQIKGLFVAGAGLWIEATPDGGGNLNLNWLTDYTLQQADNVTGPWTDIGAAIPPYSVPISPTGNKFYRVKPVGP